MTKLSTRLRAMSFKHKHDSDDAKLLCEAANKLDVIEAIEQTKAVRVALTQALMAEGKTLGEAMDLADICGVAISKATGTA
jgi:hypothetical protein